MTQPTPEPQHNPLPAMQRWLERAVIGLNLCPFAKAVHTKGQIRWVHSTAATPDALLHDLLRALQHLVDTPAEVTDTTVLVHPNTLQDFEDFNDFLDLVDAVLEDQGLDGVIQVAPFHPQFQFADSHADDISNCTNRSPYPALHLLREDSVSRAVAAFPDADAIFEKNIATLHRLGAEGWRILMTDR
jgi:uncharacterized protein